MDVGIVGSGGVFNLFLSLTYDISFVFLNNWGEPVGFQGLFTETRHGVPAISIFMAGISLFVLAGVIIYFVPDYWKETLLLTVPGGIILILYAFSPVMTGFLLVIVGGGVLMWFAWYKLIYTMLSTT